MPAQQPADAGRSPDQVRSPRVVADRHWLLTWTTYGTWLPGDDRGFVSNVADSDGRGVRHNAPHTACDRSVPHLREFARSKLVSEPVWLTLSQAEAVLDQFRETAEYRRWFLLAVSVMRNHAHLVVGVPGDPDPDDLLRDFKSYGSRRLNQAFGRRPRWWTEGGSKRKKADERAVATAIRYVLHQPHALVTWSPDERPGERPALAGCSSPEPSLTPEQPADAGRSL
ncbi:MAG TPA: transposase [Urbifossiella sp.]|nr:transposase [Urbifossiella sp.]